MQVTKLHQNPHANREKKREKNLEIAIGKEVRNLRRKHRITVADLATSTGLSVGMLSKIENGLTSPSLTTLQSLGHALKVPVTQFFKTFEEERSAMFTPKGEGAEIERTGTRAGHQYHLLGYLNNNTSGVMIEPYIITLSEQSDIFPAFQHGGVEFIYMLRGKVVYEHDGNRYEMKAGDSLTFEADAPHGPCELVELPAEFLSIISYSQDD